MISPLLLLPLALASQLQVELARDGTEESHVRDVLRIQDWESVELELPRVAPESFSLQVFTSGGPATLHLQRHSNRSEDFELLVQIEDGSLVNVPPPPVSTYRGFVAEHPEQRVAATLLPSGLKACVSSPDGSAWFLEPASSVPNSNDRRHLLYSRDDLDLGPNFCGSDRLDPHPSQLPTSNSSLGGGCFREARIAFDADFENFELNGSDVTATALNIEAGLNAVNDMYAREVAISHSVTQIIVRSVEPDPYPSFDPGTLLESFRAHWNSQQGSVVRDLAHLATGKEMDGNIIGLAWVGVVCNQPWSYGLTQYNLGFGGVVSVLAHELGHNWNAPHCLDSPCGIMCGGCLVFGPLTTQVVLDYRDNANCLTPTGGYPLPVPPKVRNEFLITEGQSQIDVLGNDFDGNCDTVVIQSFDAVSAEGGSVSLSPGTGPGGRDELIFITPPDFEGLDSFGYEVGDGTGLSTPGLVEIEFHDQELDLVLHLRFDETTGTQFADSGPHGINANHIGSPGLGQPGVAPGSGLSVAFNGVFSRATLPNQAPLNGLHNELSLSVWLRPDTLNGEQWIFGNPESWHLRLNDSDLVFRTAAQDYLITPNMAVGAWTHVVATFDEQFDVTFFVDGVGVSTLNGEQPAALPQSQWRLGARSSQAALFDGRIDDLQVYDHFLLAGQVSWIFENPGNAWADCEAITTECDGLPNSAGPGASIGHSGSPSLFSNDLVLNVLGCPSNKTGLFYYGANSIEVPFGDGLRCVGGAIVRLAPLQTDPLGFASQSLDLGAPPFNSGAGAVHAGETKRFQFWYRDPGAGGAGFNLSNALAVEFCP